MLKLFFFLIASSLIHAEIEDHFKKISDKADGHSLRNIDFIYIINLDQRPEKFATCLLQLAPFGSVPFRFSAVNGWELSLEAINDVGVKYESWMTGGEIGTCYALDGGAISHDETIGRLGKTYFCHHMYRGSIGIVLSHLSILQDALDCGYDTIWVMEDDIEILQDPNQLPDLIDRLDNLVGKEGWDILFTDQDTKNQEGEYVPCVGYGWRPNFTPSNPQRFANKETLNPEFRRIGARFGAYSMIVRRSGIKKILNFFKNYNIFHPFDIDYTLPNGIRLFTLTTDIVSTQPKAISDNGFPNYQNKCD